MVAPVQSAAQGFDSFSRSTATIIARGLTSLGDQLSGQFGADRAAVAETAPPLHVAVPGPQTPVDPAVAGPAPPTELPNVDALALEPPADDGAGVLEADIPPQPDGEDVGTSAGPPPQFQPSGAADPNHLEPIHTEARGAVERSHQAISEELAANRSAERIVPVGVDRTEQLTLPESTATVATDATVEMAEYLGTSVPPDVRAIADADFAPLLESSLAGPRQAVAGAALKRDEMKQEAFATATAEADLASAQARADQEKAITEGRDEVEKHKQAGIDESQAQLAEFDRQADEKRTTQRTEIENRIRDDQQAANATITQAEQDAERERLAAQEEEARVRQEAENNKPKKKKKKWHEKVGDWFKNAINHWTEVLTGAVKAVFNKAKEAVTRVFTAAKALASGIIHKLRDFVVVAIKAFAASIKLLVGGLLIFFPGLRKRVNAAIDDAVNATVEVVNKVAKALEDKVVSLINTVQTQVNRAIDLFETVVVTSIAIAQALLSGNFLEAAKILFLAACKAVGIPGEEFLGILSDARDALLDIMKRPASFLGNLLKAVGQGMGKFLANFSQRLIGGLTGWLFGNIAAGGITLPKSFDLKSIFMLILQVLGFTYDYVRARVVRLVGERAVSVIEQVMTPIKILFTEGPGALWHWLKDQAEEAKQAIVQAASQWLVTQIITQAAIKLATMFTPVGAFVQAVLMMYNTIMFFVEKMKEIFAWVRSITSSMKTIAIGAIGAAADYIDQAMAQSIPLIIAFLARLLGVGGIAEQIRGVVTRLRAPVDKAIDFVLEKLVAAAKAAWGGIKAGAKKVADWWDAREDFETQGGERHSLFFRRSSAGPELTIASTPEPFERYLKALESTGKVDSRTLFDLRWRYTELQNLTAGPEPAVEAEAKDRRAKIQLKLVELGDLLRQVPPVTVEYSSQELLERFSTACGLAEADLREFQAEEGITDTDILSFAADMTPVVGTLKSASELITGRDPITGKDASRWWALVGLIPWGKLTRRSAGAVGKVIGKASRWVPKRARKEIEEVGTEASTTLAAEGRTSTRRGTEFHLQQQEKLKAELGADSEVYLKDRATGKSKRVDALVAETSATGTEFYSVSMKSRNWRQRLATLDIKAGGTGALNKAKRFVRQDVDELIKKYSGLKEVRSTGKTLVKQGETIPIRQLVLTYDASAVQGVIRADLLEGWAREAFESMKPAGSNLELILTFE